MSGSEFDTVINRRGTFCTQWDYIEDRFGTDNLLPFTISDMDIACPKSLVYTLKKRIEHPIYGYSRWKNEDYLSAIVHWYASRYDCMISKDWICYSPSVMYSIAKLLQLCSEPRDGVLVFTPAYDSFYKVIENNQRRLISSELLENAGYYQIDFKDVEEKCKEARILLLCNPHNPVGRVWKKQELPLSGGETVRPQTPQWGKLLKRPGVKAALTAFFFYSALELTTGLWGSSYMVAMRGISPETAAKWISLFYLGITAGRFFSGFLTLRFSDDAMVRLGEITAIVGILLILLPLHNLFLCLGLILTGLGCAPIYPSLLHATPQRFGAALSQSLMGTQMAISYLGSTTMPPVSGFLSEKISMGLYPVLLLVFALMLTILTEKGRHCTAE